MWMEIVMAINTAPCPRDFYTCGAVKWCAWKISPPRVLTLKSA